MASFVFNSFFEDAITTNMNAATGTFYAMMCTSSYTPSQAHSRRSDIDNQVVGTGYTADGKEVAIAVSRTDGVTTITPSPVTWDGPVSGFTPERVVIYHRRGGAATADELVGCYHDVNGEAADGGGYVWTPTGPLTHTNPQGA